MSVIKSFGRFFMARGKVGKIAIVLGILAVIGAVVPTGGSTESSTATTEATIEIVTETTVAAPDTTAAAPKAPRVLDCLDAVRSQLAYNVKFKLSAQTGARSFGTEEDGVVKTQGKIDGVDMHFICYYKHGDVTAELDYLG